ncbi:MAG: M16 family metallopeptidase [Candidatus Gastranaerophilaceae bacterium]
MEKRITKLKNNIELAYKRNENTPRISMCLNFSLNNPIPVPGVYSLMSRLFLQGTKKYNAQELSEELDKYAIEFSSELKLDYLKFKIVCLNEDFPKAIEILTDIVKNTTFEEFEKERIKMMGEIEAELDSPRSKVVDNYYKNIYADHHYGYTNTVILNNLPNLKKQEIIDAYKLFTEDSRKVISFVGDLDFDNVYSILEENFADLPESKPDLPVIKHPVLNEAKNVEIIKPDMNQAHIIKGWIVPTYGSDEYPALALLNIILGASGLSSRLFLELRDKKGLAYVVRSSYDTARLGANFSIYIATEPKNIEVSLKGFDEEINKIKTELVSEEELENAKNNLFGKWAFITETNSQQSNWLAHYGVNGVGFDYLCRVKNIIKQVTPEDIKECANKYLNDNFVISILKP